MKKLITWVMQFLQDHKDQASWGRLCAAVALFMAAKLSFSASPNLGLIALWLGVATGSYSLSKWTESKTTTFTAIPPGGEA